MMRRVLQNGVSPVTLGGILVFRKCYQGFVVKGNWKSQLK